MSGAAVVFGGTFDPVHNGHLSVASQVREQTDAESVWFVLAGIPSLHAPPLAPVEARWHMLCAALQGRPDLLPIDVELRREGVSYTADTMDVLHSEHPHRDLPLLLGADAARSIQRWGRAADLLRNERFLIVNRSGRPPLTDAELVAAGFDLNRAQRISVDSPPVTATEVRSRVAGGEAIAGLVPAAVAEIIAELGLYRDGQPMHNARG